MQEKMLRTSGLEILHFTPFLAGSAMANGDAQLETINSSKTCSACRALQRIT